MSVPGVCGSVLEAVTGKERIHREVFDQAARFAISADPEFLLQRLQPSTGLALQVRRWQETRSLPLPDGPDRAADLVAVADRPEAPGSPWLLIFEIQAQHDPERLQVLYLKTLFFLLPCPRHRPWRWTIFALTGIHPPPGGVAR